jgi:hypothetical protein
MKEKLNYDRKTDKLEVMRWHLDKKYRQEERTDSTDG